LNAIAANTAVTANFSAAAVNPIPTLESWGLLLLSGLVGWLAYPGRRRAG